MKIVCGGVVRECALMYGFDAEEALSRMYESMKEKKSEKKSGKKIELPFLGTVKSECCKAVRMNGGLYTQCEKKAEQYCVNCLKDELPYGTMEERIAAGSEYKDSKGRQAIPYAKYLEKAKITQEEAKAYATSIGIELPESVFEMPASAPKKVKEVRGRPKKSGKVVEVDSSEDLFAGLVQNSINEVVVSDSADEEEKALAKAEKLAAEKAEKEAKALALAAEKAEKAEKLAAEKAEKAAKLEAEKAEKAAKLEAEKAEKAAKLAAEKAEKEAKALALAAEKAAKAEKLVAEKTAKAEKLAAEKAEKEAKLAAEKEAKAAKLEAEKEAKAAKLAAEKEAKKAPKQKAEKKSAKTPEVSDTEDEEEDEVEVKKFEFGGKKYLKSSKNVLYDAETQDEIGIWNEAKQEIEFAELEEEEEEE